MTSQAISAPCDLHVSLLGPLEAGRNGTVLELGGSKQRTLLAALALEANRVVSDGQLVDILWGADPIEGATDALRVHVHRLRRTIEPAGGGDHAEVKLLARRLTGYSLALNADQLDVERFRTLITEAHTASALGQDAHALHLFDRALALWRGPVLADFADTPFVVGQRTRLDKLRLEASEDRFDVCLRLGQHLENVSAIDGLAESYPLRERLQGQLLLALYRCGRQAEASDAYQRTRRRLADELGMEPGPDLQAIFREILRQEVAPIRSGGGAGLHLQTSTSNLPAELSSFIGREDQIAEVTQLLAANRLLTLVGPGGIGKTRLAFEVARRILDRYRDGVWLVDLAAITDPETLAQQVLTRLGFREQPELSPVASLAAFLKHSHSLLIVDNCEHLVDATADMAYTLLQSCAHLSILATSRERLNCDGEQSWSVPSLSTPGTDRNLPVDLLLNHDAVMLFVERARQVRRSFVLTTENAVAVTQLCSRLDGIPLAIELAAAQSAALSPEQLLEHIGNRFRLVAGSRRASVSRHRTMRATIDWSHRLLTDDEQLVFRRLSVFAGSFDIRAAQAVCENQDLRPDEIVEHLAKLVDKSLVVYGDQLAGEGRYRMLETMRQFAQEKLSGDPAGDHARSRHARHLLTIGEHFESRYREGQCGSLVRQLDAECSNAGAALEWAEGADDELFLSLAATWWHYWWLQGSFTEGRAWLDRALASSGRSIRTRARILSGKGRLAAIQGDTAVAEAAFNQGLTLALRAHDDATVAVLHNSLGLMGLWREATVEADAHFHKAVAIWESLNVPVGLIATYTNLGDSSFARAEYEEARSWYDSAIRIGVKDCLGTATALISLANLERHVGDYSAAREHAAAGVGIAKRTEYAFGVSSGIDTFALLAAAERRPFRAAVLASGTANLIARCGAAPDRVPHRQEAEQRVDEMCGRLDDETLAQARSLAAAMTVDELIAFALDQEPDDVEAVAAVAV